MCIYVGKGKWFEVNDPNHSGTDENNTKQEMSYDTDAPLTLTFDPKINRGHLLVIINQHVKYEDSVKDGI